MNLGVFTHDEREACLPIVDLIVECANVARKEGVLALEEFSINKGNDFLTFAMQLVCDGYPPDLVKSMLEILISTGNHSGSTLLERLIILDGVLSIQSGENPRIIETKLLCFLGEDYLRKRNLFPYHNPPVPDLSEIFSDTTPPEYDAFDKTIQTLSNMGLQGVLKEISNMDLIFALKGCNLKTAQKLLGCLSASLGRAILDSVMADDSIQPEQILEAHEKIAGIVKRLMESGEIT